MFLSGLILGTMNARGENLPVYWLNRQEAGVIAALCFGIPVFANVFSTLTIGLDLMMLGAFAYIAGKVLGFLREFRRIREGDDYAPLN
jgi:hypothetical protein